MRRALHGREISRRFKWPRRQVLCRDERIKHRVPQAQVQCQLPDGPLILRVDRVLFPRVIGPVWRGEDRHGNRRLIPEGVRSGLIDQIDVGVVLVALTKLVQVDTHFEVMRPGDVGHSQPFVKTLVSEYLVAGVRGAPSGAVPEVQADIGDRDIVEPHARFPFLVAVIASHRPAGLDQEPVGGRIGIVDRR